VALGSDYPASWEPTVMLDAVADVRALALDPTDRARVAGGNTVPFYALDLGRYPERRPAAVARMTSTGRRAKSAANSASLS
jgi:hypothetical protein